MVHILEESGVLTWNTLKELPWCNSSDWDQENRIHAPTWQFWTNGYLLASASSITWITPLSSRPNSYLVSWHLSEAIEITYTKRRKCNSSAVYISASANLWYDQAIRFKKQSWSPTNLDATEEHHTKAITSFQTTFQHTSVENISFRKTSFSYSLAISASMNWALQLPALWISDQFM